MGTLIISCSGLITCVFQNLEIKNLHHQFLNYYNSTKLYQCIQNFFLLSQLFVNLSLYLSVSVKLIHHVTLLLTSPLLRKNGKYSPSCYNVTSVNHVKVCNFFVSCQMVCEVIPIHVDVVHVTTNVTVKHWNEISLCQP